MHIKYHSIVFVEFPEIKRHFGQPIFGEVSGHRTQMARPEETMYVCIYVCMYVCMDAWMHACMYVCMYVCMSIYLTMNVLPYHGSIPHNPTHVYFLSFGFEMGLCFPLSSVSTPFQFHSPSSKPGKGWISIASKFTSHTHKHCT